MKTKTNLILSGAAALLLAGLAGCHKPEAAQYTPGPTPVEVSKPEQRTITEWSEFSARIDAVEMVEVRPRITGHLSEVRFHAGQKVKKDDVLFVIDPRWQEAEYQLAVANADQAKARWETAKTEAKRGADLGKSKAISTEEADNRFLAAQVAEAAFHAAEAGRDTTKLNLDFTQVRTPIDGIVSRPLLTAGNYVSGVAGFTTLLTTVVSTGDVFVYAGVDDATFQKFQQLVRDKQVNDPREGKVPAEVMISVGEGFAYKGFVEHFDNRIDPATGSIVLRARVPNPDGRLVPGGFAKLRIPASAEYQALLVDEQFVGTDQSKRILLTVGKNKDGMVVAERKEITVGATIGTMRVITGGLKAEDEVITTNLKMIGPGAPITPMAPAPVATAAR
jgi:RND family efflux transporter MFP subunit